MRGWCSLWFGRENRAKTKVSSMPDNLRCSTLSFQEYAGWQRPQNLHRRNREWTATVNERKSGRSNATRSKAQCPCKLYKIMNSVKYDTKPFKTHWGMPQHWTNEWMSKLEWNSKRCVSSCRAVCTCTCHLLTSALRPDGPEKGFDRSGSEMKKNRVPCPITRKVGQII